MRAVRVGGRSYGWGCRGYTWGGHMPSLSPTWIATASAYVDVLYLFKFEQIRVLVVTSRSGLMCRSGGIDSALLLEQDRTLGID